MNTTLATVDIMRFCLKVAFIQREAFLILYALRVNVPVRQKMSAVSEATPGFLKRLPIRSTSSMKTCSNGSVDGLILRRSTRREQRRRCDVDCLIGG